MKPGIVVSLLSIMIFITSACEPVKTTEGNNSRNEGLVSGYSFEEQEYSGPYFTMENFESLIVGESTFNDVLDIACPYKTFLSAYGFDCVYPMADGKWILVRINGDIHCVGAIEIIS